MPTPAKTSPRELVAIARRLVETTGAAALTVSAVAAKAGVKAPSLYKHFADRLALLKAVEIEVLGELERALRAGTRGATPRQRIASMARAYRAFAKEQPLRYGVIYSRNAADDAQIAAACLMAARPLFEEMEKAGMAPERILPASRTLTAFLHGFVTMEMVNAFRLGGDIDEAFEQGLTTVLAEIQATPPPPPCGRRR